MPISEILIVYLAFGAPLAVYHYLESRRVSSRRRIFVSVATFVFWIPFAVRLSLRHFTNASFGGDFVSPAEKKKSKSVTNNRQEAVGLAIADAGCPLPRHDLREIIERYAGLSEAVGDCIGTKVSGEKAVNFLKAAGRSTELSARCLSRRERTKLQKHLVSSRESFVALFDQLAGSLVARTRAIRRGIELALVLKDIDTADRLGMLEFDLESSVREGAAPVNLPASSISIRHTAATIE